MNLRQLLGGNFHIRTVQHFLEEEGNLLLRKIQTTRLCKILEHRAFPFLILAKSGAQRVKWNCPDLVDGRVFSFYTLYRTFKVGFRRNCIENCAFLCKPSWGWCDPRSNRCRYNDEYLCGKDNYWCTWILPRAHSTESDRQPPRNALVATEKHTLGSIPITVTVHFANKESDSVTCQRDNCECSLPVSEDFSNNVAFP